MSDTGREVRGADKSDAAFRTIREVAEELDLQQHVLRFWETKFPQVSPLKRGGGRRYYRPSDIELLRNIQGLLYTEGYTIKGVQKLLRKSGPKGLVEALPEPEAAEAGEGGLDSAALTDAIAELETIRDDLIKSSQ